MEKLRVIISGGGTGGHIFPAIAIAKAIEKKVTDVDFLFVGAQDRMEMDKIPSAGYKIKGLWISGLQRRFTIKNLLFPFKIIISIYRAKKIINNFNPHLAVGTGGYASGPLVFMAARSGIPSVIQEQNSYPGITNRLLGRYVQKICVAYRDMDRFFKSNKLILTGNPIREDVLNFTNRVKQARHYFKIDSSKSTVLVIGGSLGALTINSAILQAIEQFKLQDINLIWQTGISFSEKAQSCINKIGLSGVNAYAFIKDIGLAYAAADIIISRAGAIAISELCVIGKPTILVPSPNVSENHQYKNAQSLVNKKAALVVEDALVSSKLVPVLMELVKDQSKQKLLSINIRKLGVKDAATNIAEIALDLVK